MSGSDSKGDASALPTSGLSAMATLRGDAAGRRRRRRRLLLRGESR